ncbi:hypothetical protein SAMN05877809_103160 [Rhodobacter sp. JA431]|nr:hypothetical protein SAMN05877809_103160 [Rhodobacter sp. JA431]
MVVRLSPVPPMDAGWTVGRYTTLTILSAETGAHRNTIRAVLQNEGVQPFRPNGLDVGPIYLRNAVEPVVALLKTQGEK